MLAQIHYAEEPDLPHARLEVIGFVFVGHDADAALLRIALPVFIGNIPAVVVDEQGFEAEIRAEGIVLLQYADAQFAGQ